MDWENEHEKNVVISRFSRKSGNALLKEKEVVLPIISHGQVETPIVLGRFSKP